MGKCVKRRLLNRELSRWKVEYRQENQIIRLVFRWTTILTSSFCDLKVCDTSMSYYM